MKRACACLWTVLLLVACSDPQVSPAAPTSLSTLTLVAAPEAPFPPPAPPGTTRALLGTVRNDRDIPLAGAKALVLSVGWFGAYTVEASAATDGSGVYHMPEVRAYAGPDPIGWLLVGATQPGYFADFKWWLDFPRDANLDLRLEPWKFIQVGDAIHGEIGEAECAGLGYGGWYGKRAPCKRFALTAPSTGILEVTVSAPVFSFDVDIVNPDGTFASYGSSSSALRLRAPVQGGSTYEVRVAGGWSPAREFDLTTALR